MTLGARLIAGALAAGTLVAGVAIAAQHEPGSDARAAALYLAPDGSDDAPCTHAKPCRTFGRAYRRATPGATVRLLAGAYPDQEIAAAPAGRGAGATVVFEPQRGARVTVGEVSIRAPRIELRNLSIEGWYAHPGAGHLTFRRVHARWFFDDSVSNVRILGGSVGPADSLDSQIRAADTEGAPVPTDILIDGVDFHDFTRHRDPESHVECLQFGAGEHVVIRRSRFRNCATHGIFVGPWGGTARVHDFTFENNFFGDVPEGYYSLRVTTAPGGEPTGGIRVRYNSALQPFRVDDGVTDADLVGNVAPRESFECVDGQRSRHNVWSKARCGSSDRRGAPHFSDPKAGDLHLTKGSRAIGAGDPGDHPRTDIDRQRRPKGRGVDAGADQRRAATR